MDKAADTYNEEELWERAQREYQRILNALAGIPELPMRRSLVRESLKGLTPRQACWQIGQFLRGAIWGRTPHIDAMLATSLWLVDERVTAENFALFHDLFEAAHEDERREVLHLLRDPPPHRQLPPESRLPGVRLPMEREVSLGERRSLARGSNRKFLERLLMDPSELVISKLLDNPALQQQDVMVIASRRPTTPEILTTIATHDRWTRYHDVRETLVRNPYAETGISLRMLPTLHIKIIRQVGASGDLHPLINDFADMLVELREKLYGHAD